jgi:hypothetical protein
MYCIKKIGSTSKSNNTNAKKQSPVLNCHFVPFFCREILHEKTPQENYGQASDGTQSVTPLPALSHNRLDS